MAWRGDWSIQHGNTLQASQAHLDRASASIARSTQIAVETEEIGTATVAELGNQRETLLRARQRVSDTDAELGRSRAILRKMGRSVLTNKVILILIIILECAILGGVVYIKFFLHK